MLETIDLEVRKQCEKHLWSTKMAAEEIANCANKFDFGQMFERLRKDGTELDQPQSLINLIVSVLLCQHRASASGAKIWSCPFDLDAFPQIGANNGQMKIAILNGLVQFGHQLSAVFDNYMKDDSDTSKLRWNNVTITVTFPQDFDESNAIKNSISSGQLNEIFGNSGGNMAQQKKKTIVYTTMKNVWQMLASIGSFILTNCEKNLWHLAATADNERDSNEIRDCSKKVGTLWADIEKSASADQLILLNRIALESVPKATIEAQNSTSSLLHQHILRQIETDSEKIKLAILKGLLKFGSQFNRIFGTWMLGTNCGWEGKSVSAFEWSKIIIQVSKIPSNDWAAIQAALESGSLKQLFKNGDAEKNVILLSSGV